MTKKRLSYDTESARLLDCQIWLTFPFRSFAANKPEPEKETFADKRGDEIVFFGSAEICVSG